MPAKDQPTPDARRFWRSSSRLAAARLIVAAGLGAAFLSVLIALKVLDALQGREPRTA